MCSKCFKEVSQKNNSDSNSSVATSATAASQKSTEPELPLTHLAPAAASPPTSSSSSPAPSPALVQPSPAPVVPQQYQQPQLVQPIINAPTPSAPSTQQLDSTAPGERPVQANKGRCFMCRAKIPLAKQAINKCRCEYVFCDAHKGIDKHDCDFDFAKMGKDLLTKANPKLNDKPRGGRSFTRMD
ncbi:zinc finger domain-containing protein [Dissophora globulifera]|nr:zinc finger domain-containing protein [Dissophora globulifera]